MGQKKSKTSYFTNRGLYFGNEWHIYSYKNNKHYRLVSDVELCYWLIFLEFNIDVKTYELHPTARLSFDPRPEKIAFTAELMLCDGSIEWDLLFSEINEKSNRLIKLGKKLADHYKVDLRIISLNEIIPVKYKISPLLKVAACLSAGKEISLPFSLISELISFTKEAKQGTFGDIIQNFIEYENSLVQYAIAKLFADGYLKVSYGRNFFAHDTEWCTQ